MPESCRPKNRLPETTANLALARRAEANFTGPSVAIVGVTHECPRTSDVCVIPYATDQWMLPSSHRSTPCRWPVLGIDPKTLQTMVLEWPDDRHLDWRAGAIPHLELAVKLVSKLANRKN